MTPFGRYPVKPDPEGKVTIDPKEFIKLNWPLLCEICGFTLPVRLNITSEQNSDEYPLFYGMRTGIQSRHHEVWLSPLQLGKDLYQFCKADGLVIAGLWSAAMTMLRLILTYEGIIPRDQYLDARDALRGGMNESSITAIHNQIKEGDPEGEDYQMLFDAWVIYHATYSYFGIREWDEGVKSEELTKIIRAEKDLITTGFFL